MLPRKNQLMNGRDQYLLPSKNRVVNREQPKKEQHQRYQKKYMNPNPDLPKEVISGKIFARKPQFLLGAGAYGHNTMWV
jgi:hypothetical protein